MFFTGFELNLQRRRLQYDSGELGFNFSTHPVSLKMLHRDNYKRTQEKGVDEVLVKRNALILR